MSPFHRSNSDAVYEEEAAAEFQAAARALDKRKSKSVRFYRFEVSSVKKLPELADDEKKHIYYSPDEINDMKEEATPKAKVLKDCVSEWDDDYVHQENSFEFEDGFSQMFD